MPASYRQKGGPRLPVGRSRIEQLSRRELGDFRRARERHIHLDRASDQRPCLHRAEEESVLQLGQFPLVVHEDQSPRLPGAAIGQIRAGRGVVDVAGPEDRGPPTVDLRLFPGEVIAVFVDSLRLTAPAASAKSTEGSKVYRTRFITFTEFIDAAERTGPKTGFPQLVFFRVKNTGSLGG